MIQCEDTKRMPAKAEKRRPFPVSARKKIKRVMGIEPTYPAWKAGVLRPPGPKPGALAKLSHTPSLYFFFCFLFPCLNTSSIIYYGFSVVNNFFNFFSFFEISFFSVIYSLFEAFHFRKKILLCLQRFSCKHLQ